MIFLINNIYFIAKIYGQTFFLKLRICPLNRYGGSSTVSWAHEDLAYENSIGPCPSTWRCVGSLTLDQKAQHVSTVDRGSHPTAKVPP
jgi:hypothetical protein